MTIYTEDGIRYVSIHNNVTDTSGYIPVSKWRLYEAHGWALTDPGDADYLEPEVTILPIGTDSAIVIAEDTNGNALTGHQVKIIVNTTTNEVDDIIVEEL
jgi:limonene-1,2-epoxide hydrolase